MLSSLYYAAKLRIDGLANYLIYRSETTYEASAHIQYPLLRKIIAACTSTTANFCHLVRQLPRLDVIKVTGSLGNLIYVGEKDGHTVGVLEALFPQGYEEIDLGRISLWKLPNQAQAWLQENDLVICRVSQFFPWHIPAAYTFACPLRVCQILPLDKPMDELLAGGSKADLRWRVNRMLKQNYTYRISRSPQDLEFFYHRMLIPTAQQRHQHRAMIPPYQYFEDILKSGCLIFLCLDGKEIAATVNDVRNDIFYGRLFGFLDGNTDFMKREVNTALYWYTIEYARHEKVQAINLGSSFGWVSDGVFDYKRRWGTKIASEPLDHDQLLFCAQNLSIEWRKHLSKLGFITFNDRQFLRIYIDETDLPSIKEEIEAAKKQGLDGIQIVSANHKKNYVQSSFPAAITTSS